MKLYQHRETIIMIIIMIICIFMGIHFYQEEYMAKVVQWIVILVMTVILYARYMKKKRS